MKKKWAKIMAVLALLWIIISIVWTWLLVIFQGNQQNTEPTQEQIEQIQKLINSGSWNTSTWELNQTGITIETN